MSLSDSKKELLRSLQDGEGRIDPYAVIAAARRKSSPIHEDFTWDAEVALKIVQVEEARQLIRRADLRVTTETRTYVAPEFIRDPERQPNVAGYRAVVAIRNEKTIAMNALELELSRLGGSIERARRVARALLLSDVFEVRLAEMTTPSVPGEELTAEAV